MRPHPVTAPPVLHTRRLRLEPLTGAHAAGMFALWSDPAVCRYAGAAVDVAGLPILLPAADRADSDRIIAYFRHRQARGEAVRWAIRRAAGGAFCGAIGFNQVQPAVELAYHLLPACWRNGYASEAGACVLDWAATFCTTAVAFVDPANAASIAVLGRLGFVPAAPDAPDAPAADGTRRFVRR